jgi:6-phosphogluconolactonase
VAELIAAEAERSVGAHGSFSLALSGGRSPWVMLSILARRELPWERTEIFQVDERVAPPGTPERNLTNLIVALPIERQAALRPMPVTRTDLEAAAAEYEAGLPDRLDFVHLGLGTDGHTASLVPGDSVLEVGDRRVAVTAEPYEGLRRMTLTYPALNAARRVVWLVTGEEKRGALARLLEGDETIPAGRVEAEEMLVVADQAAAGGRTRG